MAHASHLFFVTFGCGTFAEWRFCHFLSKITLISAWQKRRFCHSATVPSLVCLERDLVCSMESLVSNAATTSLMYSLPLSEWNPLTRNGKAARSSSRSGRRNSSLIPSTHPTTSHWVTSSTRLIWYTHFSLSISPLCTESTRRYPGIPKGVGFLRMPMFTFVARVFSTCSIPDTYLRECFRSR